MDTSIDVVVAWVNERDAAYLCKEDKVVWWASITGNPADAGWQELSLAQMQRIISATLIEVTVKDIMAGFQELGKVYEMGVSSSYLVPVSIFNYALNSPVSFPEKCVKELAGLFSKYLIKGIYLTDVNSCFNIISKRCKFTISTQQRNKLYRKYFTSLGYSFREGDNRVFYNGSKVTAFIHNSMDKVSLEKKNNMWIANIAGMVISKLGE